MQCSAIVSQTAVRLSYPRRRATFFSLSSLSSSYIAAYRALEAFTYRLYAANTARDPTRRMAYEGGHQLGYLLYLAQRIAGEGLYLNIPRPVPPRLLYRVSKILAKGRARVEVLLGRFQLNHVGLLCVVLIDTNKVAHYIMLTGDGGRFGTTKPFSTRLWQKVLGL